MNTMLIDGVTADEIVGLLPSELSLAPLAEYFAALSDVTRLKIMSALSVSTLCVTDLAALTGINQTTVSHQLRALKAARLVKSTRQGKVVFYSLYDDCFSSIMEPAVGAVG